MSQSDNALRFVSAEEFKAQIDSTDARVYGIRKELAGVKVKEGEGGTLDFVLSTASPDRSNDVVAQDGWRLENYQKNPVILWAHDYSCPPVGKPGLVGVENGNLVAKGCEFTPKDLNPMGWMIGEMYRQGFLHAVSVGFRPLEWNWNQERSGGMDFHAQELLEFSCVPVPANPEALVAAKGAGIDLAPLETWAASILDLAASKRGDDGLVFPAAYAERTWKTIRPQRTISIPAVARSQEESEDPGVDAILGQFAQLGERFAQLERSHRRLAKALEKQGEALAALKADKAECPDNCCKGCVCDGCKPKEASAPPPPAPEPTPEQVGRAVAAAVRHQLASVLGRES